MNTHIEYQIISKNGKPEYAVIPYKDFLELVPRAKLDNTIPHEVVGIMLDNKISRVQAWRKYLNLSQQDVAKHMGITQAAYSQIEKKSARPRKATKQKLADALGLTIDQLW